MSAQLPDPAERPLLRVGDLINFVPGMSRSAIYEAVRRGQIPSVRIGSRVFVPTAGLRRSWGLDAEPSDNSEARPAGQALALTHQVNRGPDDAETTADRTWRLAKADPVRHCRGAAPQMHECAPTATLGRTSGSA